MLYQILTKFAVMTYQINTLESNLLIRKKDQFVYSTTKNYPIYVHPLEVAILKCVQVSSLNLKHTHTPCFILLLYEMSNNDA